MIERYALSEKRASAGKKGAASTNRQHTPETFAEDFAAANKAANAEYENEIEYEYDQEEKRIEGVQGEEGEKEPSTGFEKLWQAYPCKTEKAAARKAYLARIRDG